MSARRLKIIVSWFIGMNHPKRFAKMNAQEKETILTFDS